MDKYTLKTVFRKSFLRLIWRIEVDTASGLLAVETREDRTGNPSFSALDYRTGTSCIHEIPYADRNWTLAGIADGKLVVKAFGQNSPESAGIACIDAHNGEVVWEQHSYVLLALQGSQLIVRHRNYAGGFEQRLDLHTGDLTQINNSADKPAGPEIVLPKRHIADPPVFLQRYRIHGDVFQCTVGLNEVWAFHEREHQTYQVRMVISNGLSVLDDNVVMEGLTKMAPELFFAIADQLFLIGDTKREIVSYLV
ncbi:DUF4905 domain-containing protein [Parapedobacter deserti]|uniref:DUF4905 domain-containing protein n=1 Tax=Parapedobacter deserti TaxID=1912957 RepID=A0ABV7JDV9_9SPHI